MSGHLPFPCLAVCAEFLESISQLCLVAVLLEAEALAEELEASLGSVVAAGTSGSVLHDGSISTERETEREAEVESQRHDVS